MTEERLFSKAYSTRQAYSSMKVFVSALAGDENKKSDRQIAGIRYLVISSLPETENPVSFQKWSAS